MSLNRPDNHFAVKVTVGEKFLPALRLTHRRLFYSFSPKRFPIRWRELQQTRPIGLSARQNAYNRGFR
ncbi:hypothetical protein HDG35_005549 [Paraburkholderia sp. JPY681]|nr:hypothetical protein [Paraburkholderia atlantica]